MAVGGGIASDRLVLVMNCFPDCIINNAQFRYVLNNPFRSGIKPCLSLAGIGILDKILPVPDKPADIKLVIENAGAAFGIVQKVEKPQSPPDGRGCLHD